MKYSAKYSYKDGNSKEVYEKARFSGALGAYRYKREQEAVRSLISMLPKGVSVADCPCGSGRWWPALSMRASKIIAIDISPGMLDFAKEEAKSLSVDIEIVQGDAENLKIDDESVDYLFSFALTKHLPIPIQYRVLSEFARVSRRGVICSFGIFSHITYEFWRRRKLIESYPVFREELTWMAEAAGLKIEKVRKCTTPIGVENIILFSK